MQYNYIEKRYNVMGLSSIEAFASVKGGLNGNCKDVYFLRVSGVNATFGKEVEHMDTAQTERMLLGQGIYNRVGAFPKNIEPDRAAAYMDCYQKWLDTDKKELFTARLEEKAGVGELLGNSCKKVVELYEAGHPGISGSMEKNFVVKMLSWLDELAYEYLREWNPKQSMKFVAQDVKKEQEYFFCYYLTLLGIDVLLLQSEFDIDEKMENLHLSSQIVLGEKMSIVLEKYDRHKYEHGKKAAGAAEKTAGETEKRAGKREEAEKEETGRKETETKQTERKETEKEETVTRPRITIPPNRREVSGNAGRNAPPGRSGTGQNMPGGNSGQGIVHGRGNTPGNPGQPMGSAAANGIGRGGRTSGVQELDFEELALRASSVVMITIHDRTGEIIGSGSGIMIGREGYILTNDHVARGGQYYSVRIENDDNMYRTDEIIKYNSLLDLAVIRIDRKLQPLPIYRGSKPLARGQKVVAIGSPLGLFNSVSDGIISGFRRVKDVDMIQFTAPISHGSSGGALLNMYGEVIGVSTGGIDEGQNINLAVGYEFINTFVKGFL